MFLDAISANNRKSQVHVIGTLEACLYINDLMCCLIFFPFFRLFDSDQPEYRGSVQGVPMCRSISLSFIEHMNDIIGNQMSNFSSDHDEILNHLHKHVVYDTRGNVLAICYSMEQRTQECVALNGAHVIFDSNSNLILLYLYKLKTLKSLILKFSNT